MSDLSRLLEDVYRSGPAAPAAPAWSSDSALEDAFADWVPGPPDDAPAAEREFAAQSEPESAMDQLDALMQAMAIAPDAADEQDFDGEVEPVEMAPAFDEIEEFEVEPVETVAAFDEIEEFEVEPVETVAVSDDVERLGHFHSLVEDPQPPVEVERKPALTIPTGTWCREDDDILPGRSRSRSRSRSRGSRRISLRRR